MTTPLRELPFLREADAVMRWAMQMVGVLQPMLDRFTTVDQKLGASNVFPRAVRIDTLPKPKGPERLLVLFEAGGDKTLIYSDSFVWRRATDGSEVT